MQLRHSLSNVISFFLLGLMFLLLFFSTWNDAAIMDELAHIPAGYSYVALKDMRLNPEHPPLMKDLAGIPLLFLNLNFPTDVPSWKDDLNGQWVQGSIFLYESGNDPDQILFFSRLPMMLLSILFGWLMFLWIRSVYGNKVGLFALFLFTFSPTILAHSRYVTTDIAAALGFFIALASFLRFLEKQTWLRVFIAGASLGIALLLKFSLFLVIPIQMGLALLWLFLEWHENDSGAARKEKIISFLKRFFKMALKFSVIGLTALFLIWLVYLWHVWNYPMERQLNDAETILNSFGNRALVNIDLWMIQNKFLRPIGQYLLGLLMVVQRAAGGNTTYYLGEVSNLGWLSYFPVAYLMKETAGFHILTLLALFLAFRRIQRSHEKNLESFLTWLKDNFAVAASLIFIAIYWYASVRSPLNIGVRHVLPTFPFIYLLVSRQIVRWLYRPRLEEPQTVWERLRNFFRSFIEPIPKLFLISLLSLWIVISVAVTFPFYLSYYNEFIGINNGHRYIVDSNYDWGQDLKRLRDVMEKENIEKIYLDYFGGGSPRYYLGEKFEPWYSAKGAPPPGSYFAVSSTLLQGATGRPVRGFAIKPEDSYSWLRGLEPVRRGGLSIFVYQIP